MLVFKGVTRACLNPATVIVVTISVAFYDPLLKCFDRTQQKSLDTPNQLLFSIISCKTLTLFFADLGLFRIVSPNVH